MADVGEYTMPYLASDRTPVVLITVADFAGGCQVPEGTCYRRTESKSLPMAEDW